MKLSYRQIDGFLASPPEDIRAILVYGPDDGLMRERARTLGKKIVKDINDPFNAALLTADQIAEDPARLETEANSMSMMGGKRLVRIENAKDSITTAVTAYLDNPNENTLVIVEAGNLTPRSSLRKFFEKSKNAAALPCYVEDERGIATLIRSTLQQESFVIDHDAVTWLAARIVGDHQRARQEIQKLITYMGEDKKITLGHAQACCGTAGEQSYDDLVFSTAGGRPDKSLSAYYHLREQGIPPVAILRALQNHFRRLHLARALVDSGLSAGDVMDKKLQPPVFFKQKDDFGAQIRRWDLPKIDDVLMRFAALEAECKTSGTPDNILCSQAILATSCRR